MIPAELLQASLSLLFSPTRKTSLLCRRVASLASADWAACLLIHSSLCPAVSEAWFSLSHSFLWRSLSLLLSSESVTREILLGIDMVLSLELGDS